MSETYPDPSEVGGPGLGSRIALLAPALVIVAAVVYLVARNPGARDAFEGSPDATATVAANTVKAPPRLSTPTPTATPRGRVQTDPSDPLHTTDQTPFPARPYSPWKPGPIEWAGTPFGWDGQPAQWWQDGDPRIAYLGREGNTYGFRIDGFAAGEDIEREGVKVSFDVGGLPVVPGRVSLAAHPVSPTGIELLVKLDDDLVGLIAPAIEVQVTGTARTSVGLRVPFYHVGRRPERAFRLRNHAARVIASTPSRLIIPKALPAGAILQWAGSVARSDMRSFYWAVEVGGEWVSLRTFQGDTCPAADDPILHCFGDAAPVTNAMEQIEVGGRTWTIEEHDGLWRTFARVEGVYVVFESPVKALVLQAADVEVRQTAGG